MHIDKILGAIFTTLGIIFFVWILAFTEVKLPGVNEGLAGYLAPDDVKVIAISSTKEYYPALDWIIPYIDKYDEHKVKLMTLGQARELGYKESKESKARGCFYYETGSPRSIARSIFGKPVSRWDSDGRWVRNC